MARKDECSVRALSQTSPQSNPMTTSITFTPTRFDLMRAGLLGILERSSVFYGGVVFFVVLPWLSSLGGFVAQLCGLKVMGWASILLLAALPLLAISGFALISIWSFRNAPALKGAHHYIFSDQDIHATGPGFDTHISWNVMTHYRLHSFGLLLRASKVPMVAVPGHAISKVAQQELIALFRSKGIVPSVG